MLSWKQASRLVYIYIYIYIYEYNSCLLYHASVHAGNHCFLKRLPFPHFCNISNKKMFFPARERVCVCEHVHTKGPFLLMECASLLFLCFFLKFWLLPLNHHPPIATINTSTSTCNYHHHRPPPHTACCLSASGVCAPVGERKKTTSTSCTGWHHHRCNECLRQWLKEKCHQCKLQPVTTTMCASDSESKMATRSAKVLQIPVICLILSLRLHNYRSLSRADSNHPDTMLTRFAPCFWPSPGESWIICARRWLLLPDIQRDKNRMRQAQKHLLRREIVAIHITIHLFLLLSGDVELNPGPTYKYPCLRCEKPVRNSVWQMRPMVPHQMYWDVWRCLLQTGI